MPHTPAQRAERRKRLKAAGLCVRCGSDKGAADRAYCDPCAEKARRDHLRRAERQRQTGRCQGCGAPSDRAGAYCSGCLVKKKERYAQSERCYNCGGPKPPEGSICEPCRLAHNERRGAKVLEAVCEGRCRCGAPSDPDNVRCAACRERGRTTTRRARVKRKEAGLCPRCGNRPDEGYVICASCRSEIDVRARATRVVRVAAGRCRRCREKAVAGLHCFKHWIAMMAQTATGRASNASMLWRIWERQGGRCAYTGAPLIPGGNASVDHVTPRSRGGTNAEENLEWVTWTINEMKGNRTRDEFLVLCKVVAGTVAHDALPPVLAAALQRNRFSRKRPPKARALAS
jgi:hypothetical protein